MGVGEREGGSFSSLSLSFSPFHKLFPSLPPSNLNLTPPPRSTPFQYLIKIKIKIKIKTKAKVHITRFDSNVLIDFMLLCICTCTYIHSQLTHARTYVGKYFFFLSMISQLGRYFSNRINSKYLSRQSVKIPSNY